MKKALPFILFALFLLAVLACDDSTKPNLPPIIVVSANPVSGVAPLSVSFTAAAEDQDGTITAYSWNFGDGAGSSAQQNPSYTYTTAGTFTAACTVTDNGKQPLTASATVVVTVYQSKIPVLNSISPAWSVIHMPEFTLTATGTDFFPQSKIIFDGKEMATAYISSTQLSCKIRPDDTVLSSGVNSDGSVNLEADQYTGVLVRNPGTGGGDSASLEFTIRPTHRFTSPQLVTSKSDKSSYYYMKLLKGGPLYVIYYDWTSGSYPSKVLYIRASRNNGQSWGSEYLMPVNVYDLPVEVGSDGVLYTAYLGMNDMHFSKSSDDGATWTDSVLISEGTPDTYQYMYTGQNANIIRLADGTLYTAWMESKAEVWITDGEFWGSCAFHSYSKNDGSTWSVAEKVPNSTDNVYFPSLEKSLTGKIHYFYAVGGSDPSQATGFRHTTSSDKGISWSTPVEIFALTGAMYYGPFVGDDDGLYQPIKTTGASSIEIAVKYWPDGAGSWSTTSPAVSLGLSQLVVNMAVCVDSAGNINLFYTRGPDETGYAVWYQRSIDRGETWTAPQRLSHIGHRSGSYSQICDAAGNLYVIWASVYDPYPIYFTSSERNQ
jgi:PKD repeat protein